MKKVLSLHVIRLIVFFILVSSHAPILAAEQQARTPRVEMITPGMTRTIEISQNDGPLEDMGHFLIGVVGYGALSITLRKIDTEGDLLFLAGAGMSAQGITPIFKFGITEVTLKEAVEIGNESSPFGLLWILSWVDSTVHHPPYYYTLILSF